MGRDCGSLAGSCLGIIAGILIIIFCICFLKVGLLEQQLDLCGNAKITPNAGATCNVVLNR